MKRLGKTVTKLVVDSWLVFVGQILDVRFTWFWSFVMMSFFPLTILGFLLFFGGASQERVVYTVVGSITHAITLQAGLSVGQRIGGMKVRRVFDYYASLPITKTSFILGLNLKALVLCMPSTLVLLMIALLAFKLRLVNPGLFLVTFLLGGFSLAGVGAIIGFYSRSGYAAGLATQVVEPILTFFAPVYMPESMLPTWLCYTARAFPTTHVARLLRSALGHTSGGIWESMVFLVGFVILSFILVERGLDWRGDRPLD